MIKISRLFIFFTIMNSAILLASDSDDTTSDCSWDGELPMDPCDYDIRKYPGDLDNFPDPLSLLGFLKIYTEEDFINYYEKISGHRIRKFSSFTAPAKSDDAKSSSSSDNELSEELDPKEDFTPQKSRPLMRRNTW
jgi:hypothetical protein